MEMQRWSTRWKTKRWLMDPTVTAFITLILVLQTTNVRAGKNIRGQILCYELYRTRKGTERQPATFGIGNRWWRLRDWQIYLDTGGGGGGGMFTSRSYTHCALSYTTTDVFQSEITGYNCMTERFLDATKHSGEEFKLYPSPFISQMELRTASRGVIPLGAQSLLAETPYSFTHNLARVTFTHEWKALDPQTKLLAYSLNHHV